jgi:hypothetical protein
VCNRQYDILHYLFLAKQNEFPSSALEDSWNYYYSYDYYGTSSLKDSTELSGISIHIGKLLAKEKDEFLKRRLAFQLIKNYRYSWNNGQVDSLFTRYIQNSTKDFIYYKSLNYVTDALVNSEEHYKANYYASLLFAGSIDQKRAHTNYDLGAPIDSVLPFCKNDKERAKVYVLDAFKSYYGNVESIAKAYQLDPENDAIDQLIIREINKVDYRLMPVAPYSRYGSDNFTEENVEYFGEDGSRAFSSDHKTVEGLRILLQSFSAKNTPQKEFYNLCLAHLEMIAGSYTTSQTYFDAINYEGLTTKQKMQFLISKTILITKSKDLRDDVVREELFHQLKEVDEIKDKIYTGEASFFSIRLVASRGFLRCNDYARAFLVDQGLPESYDNQTLLNTLIRPEDIDTVLGIMSKPLTPFDKYLGELTSLKPSYLRHVQASLYMRRNEPEKALKSYVQAGEKDNFKMNLARINTNPDGHAFHPGNMLISKDYEEFYSDEEIAANKKRYEKYSLKYTNYSLVKSIVQLKKNIRDKKGDLAQNYFYLGSLYFELSYYGRAYRILNYEGGWSWSDDYFFGEDTKIDEYQKHYFGTLWAMPYYRLALKNSKDPELSAKCLFALYRCNGYWHDLNGNKNAEYGLKYLFRMHDEYAQTEYYRIKECWGLNAIVKSLREPTTGSN